MRLNDMKVGLHVPLALLSAALAGCLGGGGDGGVVATTTTSTGSSTTTTQTTTISGKAMDGYLVGAKVCLDKNINRVCDAGESSSTTTTGGNFVLAIPTADLDQYPLVVEATAASTTDEDTNAKVAANFTLSAPKGLKDANGKYIISPITALMHQYQVENTSATNAQAETAVKAAIGSNAGSLSSDYVANKADAAYLGLYKLSQVMTRVLMQAQTTGATPAQATAQVNTALNSILTVANNTDSFETSNVLKASVSASLLDGRGGVPPIDAVRTTEFGKVAGMYGNYSHSLVWAGIPYAAPPVGSLRWKAPVNPAAWTGLRNTLTFGNACVQQAVVSDKILGDIPQSEDCLTLNIWRPRTSETNLPVLVYVHGGSNTSGYGGNSYIWGGKLAENEKAVVVTINYRLNLFGWFYHAALQTSGDALSNSGNYGTLDIIQALKFVKNNISNFGGNPANVTLAGQSAGAGNVWTLVASPQASGLFHKAVPMSGGLGIATKTSGSSFGDVLIRWLVYLGSGKTLDSAGITAYVNANLNTPELQKAYLYSKSATELMTAYIGSGIGNNSSPNYFFTSKFGDGTVLPLDFATALTGIYLNNVPMLAGLTNEEGKYGGSYFALPGKWQEMFNTPDPDHPTLTSIDQIIQLAYLPANKAFTSCSDTGYNVVMLNSNYPATICANGFWNTTYFWSRQKDSLNKYRPLQEKVYAYNFAWANMPEPFKTVWGAAHVSDLPFMFGNANTVTGKTFGFGYTTANLPGRDDLSFRMKRSLGAFMRSGDPNNTDLGATWSPWSTTAGGPKFMVLDADNSKANVGMTTSDVPRP